jgi:hypothetical protein
VLSACPGTVSSDLVEIDIPASTAPVAKSVESPTSAIEEIDPMDAIYVDVLKGQVKTAEAKAQMLSQQVSLF